MCLGHAEGTEERGADRKPQPQSANCVVPFLTPSSFGVLGVLAVIVVAVLVF